MKSVKQPCFREVYVYTYALEHINTSKLSIKGPKHVQAFMRHDAKSTSQKTQNR